MSYLCTWRRCSVLTRALPRGVVTIILLVLVVLININELMLSLPGFLSSLGQQFVFPARVTHAPEAAVLFLHQLPGVCVFYHGALVQDQHLVVVANCLETMGDGDDGASELADCVLDLAVCGVVD